MLGELGDLTGGVAQPAAQRMICHDLSVVTGVGAGGNLAEDVCDHQAAPHIVQPPDSVQLVSDSDHIRRGTAGVERDDRLENSAVGTGPKILSADETSDLIQHFGTK